MSAERREHPRVNIHVSAQVEGARGSFTAMTRNLSLGGAALESEQPMREADIIRLSLFVVYEGIEDERTPPLVVGARVQWTAEGDDASLLAGVRFENMTDAQKDWLAKVLEVTGAQ